MVRKICGKCNTEQDMKRIEIIADKKSNNQQKCFTWWCPNCKDQIADSACYTRKVKT